MRIYKAVVGLAACVLSAQMLSGPQVLTYFSQVDDTDQPYAIYLPKSIEPGRKYPLVISLHGLRSNHRLNLRRVSGLRTASAKPTRKPRGISPAFRT